MKNNNNDYSMPYSIEAEQAVIGGLLLDNDAWDKILDIIDKHDFYKKTTPQCGV